MSFYFLLSLLFYIFISEIDGSPQKISPNVKIIGGEEVKIEDNPWQVSLQAFGINNCGGSIIASDVIVTAAHCLHKGIGKLYEIISGTADLRLNSTHSHPKEIIIHENYSDVDNSNDIGLIILEKTLSFDNSTQPILLADDEPVDGDAVRVTGWGVQEEDSRVPTDTLYGVDVVIVSREKCAADYADVEDATIDDSMICAGVDKGGKDACSGDSGGPLSKNGKLVGIVSWGEGCARAGYPGVYTNVVAYKKWIAEKIKMEFLLT